MTQLEKHINEALENIIFNGCRIPSALLKNYFETAITLARIETYQKSIEVIGQNITEPETDQNYTC